MKATSHWMKLVLILGLIFALFATVSCGDDDDDDDSGQEENYDDDDDDTTDDFKAGFAKVDITPEFPVRLAGYGSYFLADAFCRWSEGIHDPLYAHAIALEDGDGDSMIMVVLDVVGVIINDIEVIKNGISTQTGVPEENIIISATHTHHGPDTIGLWGVLIPPKTGRQEEYIEIMIAGSIEAGAQAWKERIPAYLEYAQGQESRFHVNEKFDDPYRMLDSTMTLLVAYSLSGSPIGSLMNWACHPTVADQHNTLISSDFAGTYYEMMDEAMTGIHMYVNGAIGAAIQPDYEKYSNRDFNDVQAVGEGLAESAVALMKRGKRIEYPDIWLFENREVAVTVENVFFRLAYLAGLMPRVCPALGDAATTYMTTFALGPVTFGTVPGEYVPNYAFMMREIMGGGAQFVIGLGQDWVGYAITPEQYTDLYYAYEWFLCPSRYAGEELMTIYYDVWEDI